MPALRQSLSVSSNFMKAFLLLIGMAIFSNCVAQSSIAIRNQNTELVCKLLDTLKTEIDTSYKVLFIDVDVAFYITNGIKYQLRKN